MEPGVDVPELHPRSHQHRGWEEEEESAKEMEKEEPALQVESWKTKIKQCFREEASVLLRDTVR